MAARRGRVGGDDGVLGSGDGVVGGPRVGRPVGAGARGPNAKVDRPVKQVESCGYARSCGDDRRAGGSEGDDGTSVVLLVVVPLPSWPEAFEPAHETVPEASSTQVCASPQATWVAVPTPLIAVATDALTDVPLPN